MLEFAIGDIHGRYDLLKKAVEECRAYAEDESYHIYLLGDYVDRGMDSRSVIEYIMELEDTTPIMGNHEQMMLQAFGKIPHGFINNDAITSWLENGGITTMFSYGEEKFADIGKLYELAEKISEGIHAVPNEHLDWLKTLPRYVATKHRLFVHAGILPNIHYTKQETDRLLWVRDAFLKAHPSTLEADGKHIVHGHTPVPRPDLYEHRTNLDTGSYRSGSQAIGVWDADVAGKPIDVIMVS